VQEILGMNMISIALGFCDFARMLHNFVATSMIKIFFVVALDCGYFIQLANMCFIQLANNLFFTTNDSLCTL
jgi:hypothetical protein